MSQNYYKIRIVDQLLNGENHIRGLAKVLGTNQTTVSRKVKELQEDNIVDFKQEGKNKVYFLKRTLEALQYVFIVEHYKMLEVLKAYPYLRQVFERVRKDKRIKLAILFGSHAKMTATKESDIDIFIETLNRNIKQEIEKINSKVSVKIGNFDRKNLLIKEIIKHHIIIKGVEVYYEKIEFV